MANKAVYSTKQVADTLALSTSSVRKYCAELELAGKSFIKSESGARMLDDTDLKTLQYMQRAINKGAKYPAAAEQAVKAAGMHAVITQEEAPPQVSNADLLAVIGELTAEVRQLREDIVVLKIAELDRQHDEALRLNAPAEVESVEVATKPTMEFAPVEASSKPGFFQRLFGRKL